MAEQNRINQKLKELLEGYKINLKETNFEDEVYKWEAIEHFKKFWDINADDFSKMFNQAFHKRENLFYQNSWGYISKTVKHFPEEVSRMFADLYDEDKALEERIEAFQGGAIELLPLVKKATGKSRLNHQQDERTISIFLTFRFPEKYFLYMDSFYREFCTIIGETVAAAGEKYIHYLELAESFKNDFVLKDEELLSLHRSILPDLGWDDKNLIVQNILYVMTNKEKGGNTRFLVANLTWNSKDWKEPTVDKTHHRHIEKGGIPLESWNFDFENQRNSPEKVYGYAQFTNQPKLTGGNNLVIFHSDNKIVGFYGKAELFGEKRELGKNKKYMITEITNMAGTRALSICLKNKLENIREKGYLEQKKRIGMVGFTYLKDLDTVNLILDEAIRLNPDQEKILSDLKSWLNDIKNDTDHKDMKNCPLNQIVYGPPGTGKTYNSINLALQIVDPDFYEEHKGEREKLRERFNKLLISDWENPQKGRISFCTFHQSFSYEDFVEGIKPLLSKEEDEKEAEVGSIRYKIHDGLFKRMADRASYFSDKDEKFVMIIDEISRGNVSQIFGELITLIEKDKRTGMPETLEVTLPYSKQKFSVPSNLYIIGTMNTADRSVEALDTALRRRFSFLEMMPDADLIASHGKTGNDDGIVAGINLVELLETMNERLTYLLDEDHQIGHSFFMSVSDADDLQMVFRDNIVPLLKEFFYNDFGKVRLILGDGFVKKIDAGEAMPEFAADEDDDYILEKTVYRLVEIDEGFDIIGALKGIF